MLAASLSSEQIKAICDEERGYLDHKHCAGYGFSMTPNAAYDRGYGINAEEIRYRDASTYRDAHQNHGWYT